MQLIALFVELSKRRKVKFLHKLWYASSRPVARIYFWWGPSTSGASKLRQESGAAVYNQSPDLTTYIASIFNNIINHPAIGIHIVSNDCCGDSELAIK